MPIYAYKCGSCGHAKDVLQKISDPQLSVCPACGAEAFTKQVNAASSAPATEAKSDGQGAAGTQASAPAADAASVAPKAAPSAAPAAAGASASSSD